MTADGTCWTAVAPAPPLLGAALVAREAADRIGPFGASLVAQMRWLARAVSLRHPDRRAARGRVAPARARGNLSRIRRPELYTAYLALAETRVRQRHSAGGA